MIAVEAAESYAISLSPDEIALAESISAKRQAINRKAGRPNQNNFDLDPLDVDRIGAVCEYATSLILGLPWNDPVQDAPVKAPDVGPYYVKGTRPPEHYSGPLHLIVRESDFKCPPGKYILALHALPTVSLRGWCHSDEVKKLGVWCKYKPNRPAWWVPERALHSMASLRGP